MEKRSVIFIYGASGSGTTTLGEYVANTLGYKHLDTDQFYWMPTNPMYTTKRDPKERVILMKSEIEANRHVVLSGSLSGWGDSLIPYFTLAVRVETGTEIRLQRLREREYKKFGARIQPGGDMYQIHQEFLDWASRYDTGSVTMRSKENHDEWQKLLQCKQIIVNGENSLDYNYGVIRKYL